MQKGVVEEGVLHPLFFPSSDLSQAWLANPDALGWLISHPGTENCTKKVSSFLFPQ